jgi:hypothetical protein
MSRMLETVAFHTYITKDIIVRKKMTDTICDTCELYLYNCRGWMMRERGCDLYEMKKGGE